MNPLSYRIIWFIIPEYDNSGEFLEPIFSSSAFAK
jgi:hypothetical protein